MKTFAYGLVTVLAALSFSAGGYAQDMDDQIPDFALVDSNEDGSVSIEEATVYFPEWTATDFAQLDTDGDQMLTQSEWQHAEIAS